MSDQNPYSAPDAALDEGQDAVYQPRILSLDGRIGRLRYLAYSFGFSMLLMFFITFLTSLFAFLGDEGIMAMVGIVVVGAGYIFVILLTLVFAKRRFNDLDRSGWWLLTMLIPLVNLLVSIYLMFFPGSDGPNKFGPAPGPNSIGVLIVGWAMPVIMLLGIAAAVLIPQFAGMGP